MDEEWKSLPAEAEGLTSVTHLWLSVIAFWNFTHLVLDTVLLYDISKK